MVWFNYNITFYYLLFGVDVARGVISGVAIGISITWCSHTIYYLPLDVVTVGALDVVTGALEVHWRLSPVLSPALEVVTGALDVVTCIGCCHQCIGCCHRCIGCCHRCIGGCHEHILYYRVDGANLLCIVLYHVLIFYLRKSCPSLILPLAFLMCHQ